MNTLIIISWISFTDIGLWVATHTFNCYSEWISTSTNCRHSFSTDYHYSLRHRAKWHYRRNCEETLRQLCSRLRHVSLQLSVSWQRPEKVFKIICYQMPSMQNVWHDIKEVSLLEPVQLLTENDSKVTIPMKRMCGKCCCVTVLI
jgi:hypothetical protein